MGDERLPLRALLVRAADRLDPTPVSLVEMLAAVERARPVTARLEPPEERATARSGRTRSCWPPAVATARSRCGRWRAPS